jgi:hypothetical protein
LIRPAKGSIEKLQESGEPEKTPQQGKRRKTDNSVPLIGFRNAIRNAQLNRSVTAANAAAADEVDFAFERLTQIHTNQRRYGRIENCFIGAGVEQTVA